MMEVVTDAVVGRVVTEACGEGAAVVSWKTAPLTASFCTVNQLKVTINESGKVSEKQFIVKQTPGRAGDPFEKYRSRAFTKEAFFYQQLTGFLNEQLALSGAEPLRVPSCYYADCTPGEEILVLEDLRPRGFEAARSWLQDGTHAKLVLCEAARLHAAGKLLLRALGDKALTEAFPLLKESWTLGEEHRAPFQKVVFTATNHMAEHYCSAPHLSDLQKWLRAAAHEALRLIMWQLHRQEAPFTVITHGDLHANNVLFKYDADGKPIDVMMVDLQVVRAASLAADVSYYTHFGFLAKDREEILPSLLDQYYDTLSGVLRPQDVALPFSREQLGEEINCNKAGLFLTLFMLPVATQVGNASDCWDGDDSTKEEKAATPEDAATQEFGDNKHLQIRDAIDRVLKEIAEDTNASKIHQKYVDIKKFTWTTD